MLVTTSRGDAARISVLREGTEASSPYTFAGALEIAFPPDWEHTTYALAVWPRPRRGGHRVSFNVGSSGNASQSEVSPALSRLLSGELRGASVYSVLLQDQPGIGAVVRGLRAVAHALRNAAGLAVHSGTRRLFLQDNGIDDETAGREEPPSADEINVLRLNRRAPDPGLARTTQPRRWRIESPMGPAVGYERRPPGVAHSTRFRAGSHSPVRAGKETGPWPPSSTSCSRTGAPAAASSATTAAELKEEAGDLLERVKTSLDEVDSRADELDGSLETHMSSTGQDFQELAEKTQKEQAAVERQLHQAAAAIVASCSAVKSSSVTPRGRRYRVAEIGAPGKITE